MPVRFGMVGTGFWAEDVHLPVLGNHPGVELVGVWGRTFANAERLAGRFGARAFARFDDMLAAVNAVCFAVPPGVQAEFVIPAARAGRHLLLEKPLALHPAVAQSVVDAITTAGVACRVFFTRRYIPEIATALPGLLAKRPWHSARVWFQTGAMLPGSPFAGCAWREEKGALWDLGPHALSVLLPVLGPVVEASATRDAHGVTALALRHADGATSTSMLTFHAAPADRIEAYEFSAGPRTERIDITPAPRQPCFAAAVTDLLQAIADPPARQGGCGVELASEVVTILSEAERTLAPPG